MIIHIVHDQLHSVKMFLVFSQICVGNGDGKIVDKRFREADAFTADGTAGHYHRF